MRCDSGKRHELYAGGDEPLKFFGHIL
jgi:hypothetical protein